MCRVCVIGIAELDSDAHALQLDRDGPGGGVRLTVGTRIPTESVISGLIPVVGYRYDNRTFAKLPSVALD